MLDLGRVVATHGNSHSVDLLMMRDGRRLTGVQVMSGSASTNTGFNDIPEPDLTDKARPFESEMSGTRDLLAVVAFYGHIPMVIGFLFPQVSQLLFDDAERMVYRHASDVYITIDKDGNTELAHPGGAYFRIGTSSEHEDLTGKDFDKKWKIARNKGKKTHVHLEIPGAVSLNFSPGGAVTLSCASTVDVTAGGPVSVNSPSVTLNTPSTHCTGALLVDGQITTGAGVTAAGDMTAGGISGMSHTHTEQGDGAEVSPPH